MVPFHETTGMLLKRYPLKRGTEQWEPSALPIVNLIGSVSFQNCCNAADKMLTMGGYSAILTVLIICKKKFPQIQMTMRKNGRSYVR